MKTNFFLVGFAFAGLVALLSCGGSETSTNNTATTPDGAELYSDKCQVCHGSDGKLGASGALDLSVSKIDAATAAAVVKNGRGGMRAYGQEMNAAETDAVVKYIMTLRK
ncbi:MAG: c-type cytochrome [Bacteroidia bacterium]